MDAATFRTFTDAAAAGELAGWLKDRGIQARVGESADFFDPTFANSILTKYWNVVLPPHQFPAAEALLAAFYELRLASVPADYYLFQFSSDELRDIFREPDAWGDLDKVLAGKILAERGQALSAGEIQDLAAKRYAKLAQPDAGSAGAAVIWGYGLSLAAIVFCYTRYGLGCGVVAVLIGSLMARGRKTLPDGRVVDRFDETAQIHGRRIVLAGILGIAISLIAWTAYLTDLI